MMAIIRASLALLALVVAATCERVSVSSLAAAEGASAFVYNPVLLGANASQASAGGTSQQRMVAQWKALDGMKVSQTFFRMAPCALRPPHVHMRATGLLYLIQGANFSVGFVTEENKPIINTITTGASAVFPVGLVHYQQNLDCQDATYIISYNNENPGTQMTATSVFGLPAAAGAASLGVSEADWAALGKGVPQAKFVPSSSAECVARCHLAGTPAQAPAAAVSAQSTNGGR